MTPKEVNFLLRDYAMKHGYEQINYTNFEADLYQTRFELADSRIMDINLETIDKVIIAGCAAHSTNQKTVSLTQLRHVMLSSK
jgi:hypothetical protein